MRAVLLGCLLCVVPRVAIADEPGPEPVPPPATPDEPAPEAPEAPETPTTATEVPSPTPEPDHYDGPILQVPIRPREIVIDVPGLRSKNEKLILGSLLAAGTIAGALGLYFHLDSRSSANEVSAQLFTGKVWTDGREQTYNDADRARTRAIIAYSIGSAFVVGAIATFIATEPSSERTVIRPRRTAVVPTRGGALATTGWSF